MIDPEEDVPGAPLAPGGLPGRAGAEPGPKPAIPHVPPVALHSTPWPVTRWTTSWLGLSSYDGIVLTADELRAMPASAQAALWQYVECGGALLVVGKASVPPSWRRESGASSGLARYQVGFGVCLVSPRNDYERWEDRKWAEVLTSWDETASPWRKLRSQVEANMEFPVIAHLGVPVIGLFLLMILFSIVIGPINILLLSRRQRRIWLLWTVPAIALSTCLTVFGYMVLAEGWRGQRHTETLTILDQGSHRAATLGWTAFYSPLTPSDGLHFSLDTELTLQCGDNRGPYYYGYRRRESGSSCSLNWSSDQHLSSGWVTARVPSHFMVRKSAVQRERVTIARDKDGSLSAVNGLGAAITSFWYADDRGLLYRATETIPAGGRAALTLAPAPGKGRPASHQSWRSLYRDDWMGISRKLGVPTPAEFLQPRTYLADLEGAPFLEEGLVNARALDCHSRVLGLLNETADED